MRRPLADAGLIFVLIIFLLQIIFPHHYADYSLISKKDIIVEGILCRCEQKTSDGERTTVIYLKNAHIYPSGMASSDIPEIPGNMEIMCYLTNSPHYRFPYETDTDVSPGEKSPYVPVTGSTLKVHGEAHIFEEASCPGMFDSRLYHEIMKTAFAIYDCSIDSVCAPTGNFLYNGLCSKLFRIRCACCRLCDMCFDEKDSGTVKTMLLGDRSSLDTELKDLYSVNGIAHILAISGLHISLIGMALYELLKRVGVSVYISSVVGIVIIILYGMLTGMAPSAARAVIMFVMRLTADLLKRTFDMQTSLVAAAVILVVSQPMYVFYSGFQFSFGAIIAVTFIVPMLEGLLPRFLSGAVGINVITLPVYLNCYYSFPLTSLLINLFVIPLMSVLLITMLLSLAACCFFIPLGKLLAIPVHFILLIYEYTCRMCVKLPFSRWVTGKPEAWQIFLYFAIILSVYLLKEHLTGFHILSFLVLAGLVLTMKTDFCAEVTFIDVGQGDSIYVTDGRSAHILVDGGSSTVSDVGKYRLEPFLLAKGVSDLDAVFITHMDSDHYSGITELIADSSTDGPAIHSVVFTHSTVYENDDDYVELCKQIIQKGIPIYEISAGDEYRSGSLKLICLYPGIEDTGFDKNEESMVLLADFDNTKVLLTGDIEGSGEEKLADVLEKCMDGRDAGNMYGGLITTEDTVILKAAHHGSSGTSSPFFLDRLCPDLAVISAGKGNRYGHPHAETLKRLTERNIPFLTTIDRGAITLRIKRGRVSVDGYKDN